MTGLDTNLLVRYIMQDDDKQAAKATKFVEGLTVDEPGFVSVVAVIELAWVLSSCFELSRDQIAQALEVLLHAKQLVIDQAVPVAQALRVYRAGQADFADCLIERTAAAAGCSRTMTFDVTAAKTGGMVLLR